jgi:hypothetical protein
VTRCIVRSIFSDYQEGAAIFGAGSPPACGGRTKFATCAVTLSRSEAIGGTEALRLALGPLRRDHHLLFYFSFAASASLVPLGCPASGAVGVAQWFVEFSDGLITKDKFCFTRRETLTLCSPRSQAGWLPNRRRRIVFGRTYPPCEATQRGGTHETPVERPKTNNGAPGCHPTLGPGYQSILRWGMETETHPAPSANGKEDNYAGSGIRPGLDPRTGEASDH